MNTEPKIKNLEIKNFRGIDHLKIDELSKINIFVGRNNIGKTTILEALWLITGKTAENLLRLQSFRKIQEIDNNSFLDPFHNFDEQNIPTFIHHRDDETELKVEISLIDVTEQIEKTFIRDDNKISGNFNNGFKLSFYENEDEQIKSIVYENEEGLYNQNIHINENFRNEESCEYLSSEINLKHIGQIITDNKKDDLTNWLKKIDKSIEHFDLVLSKLYVKKENIKKLIPIELMGDGMIKIASFFSALYTNENQFCTIDEIENGLHYKSQIAIWEMIAQLSIEKNIDLFISTHSYEMLESLVTFLKENENEKYRNLFTVHTLFKKNEKLYISSKPYCEFSEEIEDQSEIRGLN